MEEERHKEVHDEEESKWKGPLRVIGGIFLLLIIVLWLVPAYSVRLNPEPKNIPTLSEIQSQFLDGVEIGNETGTDDINKAVSMLDANNPYIKQVATKVAVQSCTESRLCHAKALYYFVRDNLQYVSDPNGLEYIASPLETMKVEGGDCDDGTILLLSLLEAVGIRAELVIIPGHAFVKAFIPESPRRYKIGDWIYLDWTCSKCKFGEIPYKNVLQISD